MKLLFWGMALILLDVNVTAGNAVIGLLPDCLGYYLIIRGLNELPEKLVQGKIRLIIPAMMPVSLAVYVMNWFQSSYQLRFLVWRLNTASAVLQLLVSWLVVQGICREDEQKNLGSATLKNIWVFLLLLHMLAAVLKLIPLVGWVCEMADLVMGICFLAALFSSLKKLQENRKK